MRATQAGMILGTAAYMSPEQARGKPVDKRADIWAFGVVLYEMLTGKPLFEGDTVSDILAGVLKEQPDLERVPVEVRRLLRRCLEKEPKRRLRDIGDAMELLDVGQAQGVSTTSDGPVPQRWPSVVAAVFALAALAVGFVHFREKPPVEQSLRYQIPPPGTTVAQHMALSPDGRNLAFLANNGGPTQVWVRAMDTLETRPLAGTEEATYPFWSPDGAYLGFFTQGKLKKIAIAGGPPQTLCDATNGRGGTWNRDGVILFSPGPASVIFRVHAAGGIPSPVTKLPESSSGAGHRFPVFLPDGVHFLYNAGSDKPDAAGVFVGSLERAAALRLLPDITNALYTPPITPGGTAHILFRREDTLMAQPFDAKGLKATGEMFPIAEQVPISGNVGFGAFSVSENGMLVYRSGGTASNRELIWMDRAGKRLGAVGKPGQFGGMAVSPDEKTLALGIRTASQTDIWLQDMARGVLSRFTFHSGTTLSSVWSPDGNRLVFALQMGTYSADIYQKPAGGNGQEELLLHAGVNGFPDDWSPDGKWIVYQETGQKTANDLWLLPLSGDRKPLAYLQTPFDEAFARFSPDGRWMAYQSNESGRFQIYVQTVPPSGAKYQISSSGGAMPQWRRDGKELFYVAADQKLMAVPIKLATTVEAGTPQPLFAVFPVGTNYYAYAPMRDGQRFLVNVPAGGEGAAVQPITVVTNWQRSLAPQSR
jgi:Tol biopolymer transport system component